MKVTALKQVSYDPSVFLNVETVDEAVRVILTPEAGLTSQQRWKTEAPFIMEILKRHIKPQSLVLDYGCGIGRISKPLIEMLQCEVWGVDISPNMRALAASCVDNDNFVAMSPKTLNRFPAGMFDAAVAIWTLQHVLDLGEAILMIHDALKPGGILFVLNNHQRAIPSNAGPWLDDGKNVNAEIVGSGVLFQCIERGELEGADIAGSYLAKQTFWAVYRKA